MSARVTRDEFDRLFDSVKNWGRWGQSDERGTLNLITPVRIAAATRLVRHGCTVSMAHSLNNKAEVDNTRPALHYMRQLAHGMSGEPTFNMDFIGIDYHGKVVSHVDALCHCVYRGKLFNGVAALDAVTSTGATFASVTNFADGIVGRGVLLDMPRYFARDWLEPGTGLTQEQLEQAAAKQNVQVGEGDILLVRTGHFVRRSRLGPWNPDETCAGLHVSCASWLHHVGVAVLGSDADTDVRPSPVDGVHTPFHVLAIAAMGMPLLDNLDLERLAEQCAEQSRWEFLFMAAPLRVPGGTGSPINPLGVL